jgi:drug/metabolite transporter (DMT)-like permease
MVSGGCVIVGAVFALLNYHSYTLFSKHKGPQSGFMPFTIALLLMLLGIVDLLRARRHEEPTSNRKNWFFVLCVVLSIASSYLIGLLAASFVFAFCWLRFREKLPWRTVAIVMLFITVFVLGIFVFWLNIPFTKGVLGEMIFN